MTICASIKHAFYLRLRPLDSDLQGVEAPTNREFCRGQLVAQGGLRVFSFRFADGGHGLGVSRVACPVLVMAPAARRLALRRRFSRRRAKLLP